MRVWLLHIGEELSTDGPVRPWRYTYLAEALSRDGHEVLRWAPTFRHTTKTQRYSGDERLQAAPNYEIQFVHAAGYDRNVSVSRMRMYRRIRDRFHELAEKESRPDVIVAAIPSLEWSEAACVYGAERGTPVVVDVRDLWPDVFLNAVPTVLRGAARLALRSEFRRAERICRQADALCAVSPSYLQWALRLAQRERRSTDQVFPIGFENPGIDGASTVGALRELDRLGVDLSKTLCTFAGGFGRSYDLDTVIHAARWLAHSGRKDLQFVLCGDGADRPRVARLAKGLPNVVLPGWIDATTLAVLRNRSAIGLAAYAHDALQSLPNKPFEYLASGMAIVSCLKGELADLLAKHQCGVTYRPGDSRGLAEAIAKLSDAPWELRSTCSRAQDLWSTRYRASTIYKQYSDYLTNCVDHARETAGQLTAA